MGPGAVGTTGRLPFRGLTALALSAIVLLGGALRVYNLADNPYGFFADEAAFGYNAYTILRHGTDEYGVRFPLLFRSFDDYKLPVHTYALVPFIAVFGLTETAVRLSGAFFGIATIPALYLLGRVMFRSEVAGLLGALVLAVEPWHLHYSRTGFEFVSSLLFLVLAIAIFLQGLRHPSLLLVSAALFGLTFYTYRSAWVFVPPLLVALALLYWTHLRHHRRVTVLAVAVLAAMLLPLAQHLVFGSGDRIRQLSILGTEQRGGRSLWDTYEAYFTSSFLFQRGDDGPITRHYLPGHGQIYWIQAPFLLLGLASIVRKPTKETALLLIAFLFYPIPGLVTDANLVSNRTIHGAILYALLTAIGVVTAISVLQRLSRPWSRFAMVVAAGVLLAISLFQVTAYLQRYHSQYPHLSAGYWGWQWGPELIVPYFGRVQDGYDDLFLDGEFNAPHIFLRFYAPERCGKCRIGNTDSYNPERRQLFALRPQNLKPTYHYDIKETLRYPNEEVAFHIVEIIGTTPSQSP